MVKGSTSSKQVAKGDSSLIRNVKPPQHTKFCRYAQEFHDERGLSMTGIDPHQLHGNNDILEKEWDAVFTCPKPTQGSSKKVKAYHVRPQFADDLVQRHWDVYQEGPFMYEIGMQFAKAFALENCPAAKKGTQMEKYTIAWAAFAERVMKSSEERHHIDNKLKRWEDQMIGRGKHSLPTSIRSSAKTVDIGTGVTGGQPEGFSFHLADEEKQELANMKANAELRVAEARSAIDDAKMQVELAVRDLHRAEGAQQSNAFATQIQKEIDVMTDQAARQRLIQLLEQFQTTPDEDIVELQKKVATAKALLEEKEMDVSRALAHLQFCCTLEATVLAKGPMLLKCLPPRFIEGSQMEVSINGFRNCAGCGLPFDAQALETFSLPCCHVYHMQCYVHICREHSCCVAGDCKEDISLRAKLMMGHSHTSAEKETTTEKASSGFVKPSTSEAVNEGNINIQVAEQYSHAGPTPMMETTAKEAESTPKNDDIELLQEGVVGKSVASNVPMMTTPRRSLRSMQGAPTPSMQCRASGAGSTDWTDIEASVADAAKDTPGDNPKKSTPKRARRVLRSLQGMACGAGSADLLEVEEVVAAITANAEVDTVKELPTKSTPKRTSSMPQGGDDSGSPNLDEPIEHWVKKRKPAKKLCISDKTKHVDVDNSIRSSNAISVDETIDVSMRAHPPLEDTQVENSGNAKPGLQSDAKVEGHADTTAEAVGILADVELQPSVDLAVHVHKDDVGVHAHKDASDIAADVLPSDDVHVDVHKDDAEAHAPKDVHVDVHKDVHVDVHKDDAEAHIPKDANKASELCDAKTLDTMHVDDPATTAEVDVHEMLQCSDDVCAHVCKDDAGVHAHKDASDIAADVFPSHNNDVQAADVNMDDPTPIATDVDHPALAAADVDMDDPAPIVADMDHPAPNAEVLEHVTPQHSDDVKAHMHKDDADMNVHKNASHIGADMLPSHKGDVQHHAQKDDADVHAPRDAKNASEFSDAHEDAHEDPAPDAQVVQHMENASFIVTHPLRIGFSHVPYDEKRYLVLDLNGLLIKRYRIHYFRGNPAGFAKLAPDHVYKVITPKRVIGKAHIQYVVRPDAGVFLQFASAQFHLVIWTSCTKENANEAIFECFDDYASEIRYHLKAQKFCRKLDYKLSDIPGIRRSNSGEKPIFLKVLDDLLQL